MRIVIEREGRSVPVEVPPGAESVSIEGHSYPVVLVRTTALLVELEIAGERVLVDNWPEHFDDPPGPVDVNGERWKVGVTRGPAETGTATALLRDVRPVPGTTPAPPSPTTAGTPIFPPMPGKIIEIRVKEGDRVAKGDVLLVLEAMKMRNEMTSPSDGVVRGIAVQAGANARAKVPMLYIAPS